MQFIPGETYIAASGALIGDAEKQAMHDQVSKGWLTAGEKNREFERRLSEFTGIANVRTCNSGSSANLLAVAAMVESGIWKAGDEIITAACGFPTTVNPLLLYGLVPVFVDVELGTYNASHESIKDAISTKTNGIMMAHTLGNPLGWRGATFGMPMVEDCCDALGSLIDDLHVGLDAHISTCSFFPAHHITTGEGGAVFTKSDYLLRIIESVRDWGRDCYCEPGQNNTCGKRFDCVVDGIPYDHKYMLSYLGFNLKLNEIGAVCGVEQIKRLPQFVDIRRRNFAHLWKRLSNIQEHIILPLSLASAKPSWFGFPITIREPGQRQALQEYLWSKKIDTRLIFAGNLTRQPYMKGRNFRISGSLANSDKIMADSLWLGVWPGLTEPMIDYVADMVENFFS